MGYNNNKYKIIIQLKYVMIMQQPGVYDSVPNSVNMIAAKGNLKVNRSTIMHISLQTHTIH